MLTQSLTILLVAVALFATACTTAAPASTSTTAATAPTATTAAAQEPTAQEAATAAPAEETTAADTADEAATAAPAEAAATGTMTKLNLNTVTGDELLATIPDFGNRMVREFQEYRPYVSIQQFRREIGKYVDDAQVAFYEEYVYVPVSINDSDAATLMQIPGIDDAAAEALMAARPYDTNDAFLQKLAEVAPDVDQAVAQAYLETAE